MEDLTRKCAVPQHTLTSSTFLCQNALLSFSNIYDFKLVMSSRLVAPYGIPGGWIVDRFYSGFSRFPLPQISLSLRDKYIGTTDDWDFWSGQKRNWYLTPVVNFGEVRRAQLAKSTLLTSKLVTLGSFKVCSYAKERVGFRKQREATAPIQSLVKQQPWFLSLWWKTCLRQNCSLGSCTCSEGPALGQNTLIMMIYASARTCVWVCVFVCVRAR